MPEIHGRSGGRQTYRIGSQIQVVAAENAALYCHGFNGHEVDISDNAHPGEGSGERTVSNMSEQFVVAKDVADHSRINRAFARLCTLMLTATVSLSMTLSAYTEAMRPTRLVAVLVVVIALHLLWYSRFFWRRESTLYACFVGYMVIALLWTRDVELAINTLAPAMNFILVMMLFGSLMSFHNAPTVLAGALCGFVVGAAFYTLTQGFPFSYPIDFSYNAIAGIYLFGLFVTLMYSCFRRSYGLLLAIALVIMFHIVATTSIKTNLGILLGSIVAGTMYFRYLGRLLGRKILLLIVLGCGLVYAVASNDILLEKVNRGANRVLAGFKVLQTRDDVAGGYKGFAERDYWKEAGIDGWKVNPVFGYGTEAFRHDFGITSHSTPIDLLYNYGLIGLILFYSVFASLFLRLLQVDSRKVSSQRSLILAGVVCYVFVSLSGTMHYNVFLAAFIGISVALITSHRGVTASMPAVGNQRGGSQ